jgi:hypothetical protein
MRFLIAILFSSCFVAACGGGETSPSTGSETAQAPEQKQKQKQPAKRTGVPECDEVIDKYLACLDKMPADHRDQMKETFLDRTREWTPPTDDAAGRAELALGCRREGSSMKAATEALGCRW